MDTVFLQVCIYQMAKYEKDPLLNGRVKCRTQVVVNKKNKKKQNRSTCTEGCSKLKRSVNMTSSGKNGLNIRTNASPKWDRTSCLEE